MKTFDVSGNVSVHSLNSMYREFRIQNSFFQKHTQCNLSHSVTCMFCCEVNNARESTMKQSFWVLSLALELTNTNSKIAFTLSFKSKLDHLYISVHFSDDFPLDFNAKVTPNMDFETLHDLVPFLMSTCHCSATLQSNSCKRAVFPPKRHLAFFYQGLYIVLANFSLEGCPCSLIPHPTQVSLLTEFHSYYFYVFVGILVTIKR